MVELYYLEWLRSSLIDFFLDLNRLALSTLRGAPVFKSRIKAGSSHRKSQKTFYLAISKIN